jgi:hypothetical protein
MQLYSFFNLGTRWGLVFDATPRSFYPRERPGTQLYRRLGWLQGRSGRVQKISPPPGFDPRVVQPIMTCYTEYAIPALLRRVKIRTEIA